MRIKFSRGQAVDRVAVHWQEHLAGLNHRARARKLPRLDDAAPREKFLSDGHASHEERFPTPAIFPKY